MPPGLSVRAPALDYDLAPGEYAEFALDIGSSAAGPGLYFAAARIRDDLGQVLEDVVGVQVGTRPVPDTGPGTAPDDLEVLAVGLSPGSLRLRPGAEGEIIVRLRNTAASPVRGEAQLTSPYGTWGPDADVLATPWTRGFAVPAGETVEVPFRVRAAAGACQGTWWALVKVAYFGHLHYTETIGIQVVS